MAAVPNFVPRLRRTANTARQRKLAALWAFSGYTPGLLRPPNATPWAGWLFRLSSALFPLPLGLSIEFQNSIPI
jgi:hypothetical protein